MQFGMSTNFATVDLENLPFPSTMLVDYVRVYQKKDQKNIGCDPEDFPTADYINTYVYFLWYSIVYMMLIFFLAKAISRRTRIRT